MTAHPTPPASPTSTVVGPQPSDLTAVDPGLRDRFLANGYVAIPDVLDASLLTRLAEVTDAAVAGYGPGHAARERNTGSMVPVTADPAYVDLIALPAGLAALGRLGYRNPRFSDGWVISKPGGGPRLFWHYDWFTWQDDTAYQPEPVQVSLMYYLNSTTRENGCLRVIPGSHRWHNPMHDLLTHRRDELTQTHDLSAAEFGARSDEVDVEVAAGDLLITDARLLHAGHANTTTDRRRLVTLWYQPALEELPDRLQAQMAAKAHPLPDQWPVSALDRLRSVRTSYSGTATPYEPTRYDPGRRRLPQRPATA